MNRTAKGQHNTSKRHHPTTRTRNFMRLQCSEYLLRCQCRLTTKAQPPPRDRPCDPDTTRATARRLHDKQPTRINQQPA